MVIDLMSMSSSFSSDLSSGKDFEKETIEDTQLSKHKLEQIRLETYINQLNLSYFAGLSNDAKDKYLQQTDAVDIFHTLKCIHKQTNILQLENFVLKDFLIKNEPCLLEGIEFAKISTKDYDRSIASMDNKSITSFRASDNRSLSRTGHQKTKAAEIVINLRGKIEISEKLIIELNKRIEAARARGIDVLKVLYGQIKQYQLELSDQATAMNAFRLYFAANEDELKILRRTNEAQAKKKLYRYVKNYQSSAQIILNKMRLQISVLDNESKMLESEIVLKSEIAKGIDPIDFEQLLIIRNFLYESNEQKRRQAYNLKMVTANSQISMARQRYGLVLARKENKKLADISDEVKIGNARLQKDANTLLEKNEAHKKEIRGVKKMLDRFGAPSIRNYIDMKDKYFNLEKEKIILERKLRVAFMKFNHLLA